MILYLFERTHNTIYCGSSIFSKTCDYSNLSQMIPITDSCNFHVSISGLKILGYHYFFSRGKSVQQDLPISFLWYM